MSAGMAAGNSAAQPPWEKLGKPSVLPKMLDLKYLPDGFMLSDPQEMSEDSIEIGECRLIRYSICLRCAPSI